MEANELMIGDWVKFPTSDLCHKVYAVQGKSVKIDKLYWHKAEKLEPIPLSTEILEKNGFKKDVRDENYYKWNWYIFEDNASYDMETGVVRIFKASDLTFCHPIGYVHELQHAFRLCGIDKEIKL